MIPTLRWHVISSLCSILQVCKVAATTENSKLRPYLDRLRLYGSWADGIWRFRRRLAPYGIDLLTIGDNRRTEGWCSDLADNGREHIWLRDGIMLPAARAADCCA